MFHIIKTMYESVKEALVPYDNTTPAWSFNGQLLIAKVVDVYDGDTITVVFPHANGIYKFKVRLDGIDACERISNDPEKKKLALAARNRILQLIGIDVGLDLFKEWSNKEVVDMLKIRPCFVSLTCKHFDKYGRILADVATENDSSLSKVLINESLACYYDGGTKPN